MYSAEPLPHFVDEYLAYLHEVHPTTATFDGVHIHDDLLEDLSRQAIDGQVRDLGGLARRLAAIEPLAARSGAAGLPLDPGSLDACLLVTLNPGSYTAIVSGANNGAGEALVELYEVR